MFFFYNSERKKFAAKEKKNGPLKVARKGASTYEMKASTKGTELPLVLFQAEQEIKDEEKGASCPRRRCVSSEHCEGRKIELFSRSREERA